MSATEDGRGRLWAVAVVVAVVFTLLGTPQVAFAHNALISTTPGDGTTVAGPPSSVVLTFNEPAIATGTKVLVTGPDGVSATTGDPRLVDSTVEQDLSSALPAGEYEVEWRVTSADGHPINGRFTFTVRTGSTSGASTPAASATPSTDSSASPSAGAPSSEAPTPAATPVTSPVGQPPVDQAPGSRSGWWWLLAVVPVGLAAVLGWRFNRRR